MSRPLNRRLVLEAAERLPDGAGGYLESWAGLGQVWAQILPGSGGADGDGVVGTGAVPLRIVVRAAPVGAAARPAEGQRFRDGSRLFRILAVAEADPAGRYLTCFAREERAA